MSDETGEPTRDSRVPWAVMGFLGLALLIGGVAAGKKEEKKKEPERKEVARAIVVPADKPRTVVVAPCDAPFQDTVANAAAARPVPLATIFELPRGDGVRTVLVPHCVQGSGTAGGRAPAAAIVLASRADDAGAEEAESRAIVPNASDLTTIVVPRCTKPGIKSDSVLGPHENDPSLAVAREC